jgi:hypothetical protein
MKPADQPGATSLPLHHLLRGLGDELRATEPPTALRARVLAACDAATQAATAPATAPVVAGVPPPEPASAAFKRRWIVGLTAAMAMLAVVFVANAVRSTADTAAPVRARAGSPFVALVSQERLQQLAREPMAEGPPWVVATEMPRERLAAFGLPYDPARAGESVRTELLMHPAGEVLAVRIVR